VRRVLPIAILAVPFLVRYAVAEKGGCEKITRAMIACPEPSTIIDCYDVALGVCESKVGQVRQSDFWGKAPSANKVYTISGTAPDDDHYCYADYNCIIDADNQCVINLQTEVWHRKTIYVTKACP
jgi:hypothetical protein